MARPFFPRRILVRRATQSKDPFDLQSATERSLLEPHLVRLQPLAYQKHFNKLSTGAPPKLLRIKCNVEENNEKTDL